MPPCSMGEFNGLASIVEQQIVLQNESMNKLLTVIKSQDILINDVKFFKLRLEKQERINYWLFMVCVGLFSVCICLVTKIFI